MPEDTGFTEVTTINYSEPMDFETWGRQHYPNGIPVDGMAGAKILWGTYKDNFKSEVIGETTEQVASEDASDDSSSDDSSEDPDYVSSKGYAQRTKGYNPYLQIKKKTKGQRGAYTRGSLRVKKPTYS